MLCVGTNPSIAPEELNCEDAGQLRTTAKQDSQPNTHDSVPVTTQTNSFCRCCAAPSALLPIRIEEPPSWVDPRVVCTSVALRAIRGQPERFPHASIHALRERLGDGFVLAMQEY